MQSETHFGTFSPTFFNNSAISSTDFMMRVVSFAYLNSLIHLLPTDIPQFIFFNAACIIYSPCKLNRYEDIMQPCLHPFLCGTDTEALHCSVSRHSVVCIGSSSGESDGMIYPCHSWSPTADCDSAVKCLSVVNEHKNQNQALFICLLYQTSYVGNLIMHSVAFLIISLCIGYLLP